METHKFCITDNLDQNWFIYVTNGEIYAERTDYKTNLFPLIIDEITSIRYRIYLIDESLLIKEDSNFLPTSSYIKDTQTNEVVKFGSTNGQLFIDTLSEFVGRRTYNIDFTLINTILLDGEIEKTWNLPLTALIEETDLKSNLNTDIELEFIKLTENIELTCAIVPTLT